jgi:hypothetical protein
MVNRLGPLEIDCDAPPYEVVQACQREGFRSPLDVRWCQLGRFLTEQASREKGFWRVLLWLTQAREPNCTCGQALPDFLSCKFGFASGAVRTLLLGQCPRCGTIFWQEPSPRGGS